MANLRAGTTVGGDAVFTVGNISSYGLNFLNGNVGIGTAAPSKTLTIDGNLLVNKRDVDNGNPTMLLNSGGAADHATLDIYDKDGNDGARITANGDSWLSAKGGNVGIGTTSPGGLLHVAPKNNVDANEDPTNESYFKIFDNATSGTAQGRNGGVAYIDANYYLESSDVFVVKGRGDNKLTIKGSGNVGIGVTNPGAKLEVARLDQSETESALKIVRGDTGVSYRPTAPILNVFNGQAGGTEVFRVQGNGNVGIGTTNPLHKLHVRDGVQDGSMSVGGSHDIYGLQFSYDQASATESTIRANTDYDNNATLLKISTNNNTNQLVLKGDGNVGIGTTSPSTKLEIAGNVRINGGEDTGSQLVQWCDSNGHASIASYDMDFKTGPNNSRTDSMSITSDGNVGIGTTDIGSYRLNVNGSTNVQGTLHTDALFLKSRAYEMWHRAYVVKSGNPQEILTESGVPIDDGGSYRVTAHIPSTGTHTGASAVFWNSDGVWYVNHTVQPTESSNHIGFYVSGDNKPRIQTWHTADYSISVLHERVFLGESSTENTRYLFGMDGLLSYRSDSRLYLNGYTADGSTTDTTTIASDKGKRILHQTSSYSGWDVYKLSENGLLMANDSAADNIWIGANTTYDSGGFKSLAAGRSSWGYLGGGSGDQVFAVFTDLSTVAGEVILTSNNEMFSVTNTTTYDHGNANVHAGNIETYLPDHNHNASEITAGTLSSARIPAATDTSLGGVKVSYDTITKTLSITTI